MIYSQMTQKAAQVKKQQDQVRVPPKKTPIPITAMGAIFRVEKNYGPIKGITLTDFAAEAVKRSP